MPNVKIKVLVVDDSAFARKVLRECLEAAGIEVVGIARDGLEALEMIASLAPDVITLDVVMPNLDGLGVLKALEGRASPLVVVVMAGEEGLPFPTSVPGAFDVVHKPTALAMPQLFDVAQQLVESVKAAVDARRSAG